MELKVATKTKTKTVYWKTKLLLVSPSQLYALNSLEPKDLELHTLLQVSIKACFYLLVALQTLGSSLAPWGEESSTSIGSVSSI